MPATCHSSSKPASNVLSVVASIFVNPTQFGPSEDFCESILALCHPIPKNWQNAAVVCLFLPEVKDIYPQNFSTYVNVEGLSDRLEGRLRPGHFRGVSTVVLKLCNRCSRNLRILGGKTRSRPPSFHAWLKI